MEAQTSPPPLSTLRQLSRLYFSLHVLNTDLGVCVSLMFWRKRYWQTKSHRLLRSFRHFILCGILMLNCWMEPCFYLWQHGVLNCLIWAWMSSHIVLTGLFSFHTLQPAVTGPQRGRVKRIWTAILGARAGRLAWARAQTSRLRASSPLNTQRETRRDAVPPALITHRSGTPAKTISASAGSVELLHPMEKQPDDANKQWNEISSKGKFMVLGGEKKHQ